MPDLQFRKINNLTQQILEEIKRIREIFDSENEDINVMKNLIYLTDKLVEIKVDNYLRSTLSKSKSEIIIMIKENDLEEECGSHNGKNDSNIIHKLNKDI